MTVNGDLGRRMNKEILLIVDNPGCPSPQIVQHASDGGSTHLEGIVAVIRRKPALLVKIMDLIYMDKVIHEQHRGSSKDLTWGVPTNLW